MYEYGGLFGPYPPFFLIICIASSVNFIVGDGLSWFKQLFMLRELLAADAVDCKVVNLIENLSGVCAARSIFKGIKDLEIF